MVDIEYDKDLDIVNIEVFDRTGTYNETERRFRCVCCKKPTCIADSYSSRGHRMICLSCLWKYFDSLEILRREYFGWARMDAGRRL